MCTTNKESIGIYTMGLNILAIFSGTSRVTQGQLSLSDPTWKAQLSRVVVNKEGKLDKYSILSDNYHFLPFLLMVLKASSYSSRLVLKYGKLPVNNCLLFSSIRHFTGSTTRQRCLCYGLAYKAYLTFMYKKQKCYDNIFVIF